MRASLPPQPRTRSSWLYAAILLAAASLLIGSIVPLPRRGNIARPPSVLLTPQAAPPVSAPAHPPDGPIPVTLPAPAAGESPPTLSVAAAPRTIAASKPYRVAPDPRSDKPLPPVYLRLELLSPPAGGEALVRVRVISTLDGADVSASLGLSPGLQLASGMGAGRYWLNHGEEADQTVRLRLPAGGAGTVSASLRAYTSGPETIAYSVALPLGPPSAAPEQGEIIVTPEGERLLRTEGVTR